MKDESLLIVGCEDGYLYEFNFRAFHKLQVYGKRQSHQTISGVFEDK
jgi:hypothetical protein